MRNDVIPRREVPDLLEALKNILERALASRDQLIPTHLCTSFVHMSQPPQCKKQITTATNSWSLVNGHMQPLRSGVSPTLPPAKAQELVQKQIEYKERKENGHLATDMNTPWTMPVQYAPSPQTVPANLTPFTTIVNTAGETGMSQARFETPPPPMLCDETPLSPVHGQSLDEIATSALHSDALVEAATGPTDPFMTLAQISVEGEINTAIAEIVGKRKLLLEELGTVNTRIKTEVSMIENTCAIELPRVHEALKPLQKAYVEARQEILFERDLLQDAKRAAEIDCLPFARNKDYTSSTHLLDELDPSAPTDEAFEFSSDPAFPGFKNWEDVLPMQTKHAVQTDSRTLELRLKFWEFEKTQQCPWCFKRIVNAGALKNHVVSAKCTGADKPTKEELAPFARSL